jgi:hypothetical protein
MVTQNNTENKLLLFIKKKTENKSMLFSIFFIANVI